MRYNPLTNECTLHLPAVRSLFFAALFAVIVLAGFMWQDTHAQVAPNEATIRPVEIYMPVLSYTGANSAAKPEFLPVVLPAYTSVGGRASVRQVSANWTIPIDAGHLHAVYVPALSVGGESVAAPVCPVTSEAIYSAIPIEGSPVDRPAPVNPDLNLSVRGYISASVALNLVDINGPADPDAPQLAGITPGAASAFTSAYQVYDWDWACASGPHGCRSAPISAVPVSLIALASHAGNPVRAPSRHAEVFGGGYIAMVLYAEEQRITLTYTRRDTPAVGYVVHIEDVCIDPNLLALYRELDAAGRYQLPALHDAELLGVAADDHFKVAIRDSGQFMDPRSRKDWWQGY